LSAAVTPSGTTVSSFQEAVTNNFLLGLLMVAAASR